MQPKDFIKSVLIDELGSMISGHPYISFIVMGIGIEFLGKCLATEHSDWNEAGHSKRDFENAIESIPSLKRYSSFLVSYNLYSSFRCGLAHAISPKQSITLSSKEELTHLTERDSKLNLKVEDFFIDFKDACEYVIEMSFLPGDKMNAGFLQVPSDNFHLGTVILTGMTSGYSEGGLGSPVPDASGTP